MKKFAFALTLALLVVVSCLTPDSFAMYARYTTHELIEQSELIVEGVYIGESTVDFSWSPKVRVGVIEVRKTLKGDAKREHVYLKIKDATLPVSSEDIAYKSGQAGLWLLSRPDPRQTDLFGANHPQRFLPESEAATIAELISLLEASEG